MPVPSAKSGATSIGGRIAVLAVMAACVAVYDRGQAFASEWRVVGGDAGAYPRGIVPEPRESATNGLPDGLVVRDDSGADITAAWYTSPTARYAHGAIGDTTEAGALTVETADGWTVTQTLPDREVFEDRYPRLADLDGDGRIEVVTIRADARLGAAVTVHGLRDRRLVELASSDFIGTANRWLNIAGIADFSGGGGRQIAYVQTPHIGGILRFVHLTEGGLEEIASARGFSNHAYGSRELRLSAVIDIDGDGAAELALPSADRRALRIVGLVGGGIVEIATVPLPAQVDKAIAVVGQGASTRFVLGLADGSVVEVLR